jgi:hypothetical protein
VCLGSNLTLCRNPDPPYANNATCSTSGAGWINPVWGHWCTLEPPHFPDPDCPIAVQPRSWSMVKSLYRD